MSLAAGTRLGHYEILALVGRGGMAIVYRARDTRLDRIVAIKVMREPLPALRERFAREVRAVAALQHPHVCTLYDVGVHDGSDYFVMEYIDGAPLRGPLPPERVAAYGIQIADALDAAHRRGIVHRDLKPANILLTKAGVKVLDFGIARVAGLETLTGSGEVVGTPAYMAPEQWTGAAPDARTDIYGLGRLLLEMATGGSDASRRIEPPSLDAVVQGCLADDPDDRWQSARDVRRVLEAFGREPPRDPAPPRRSSWLAPAVAVAVLAVGFAAWRLSQSVAPAPVLNLTLAPPPGATFVVGRNVEGGIALSPDGRMLAFVASTEGHARLWVRRLDTFEAHAIPGTDGAYAPFWSPDSRQIAFYTPDRLMRVAVDGGDVHTVTETDPRSTGGTWMAGDVLLVTGRPGSGGPNAGIHRVSAAGGEAVHVVDGHWPVALPDGRRFLFVDDEGVRIASLQRPGEARRVAGVPRGRVAFARGHLIYARGRTLVAQPFDADRARVTGDAFPIATALLEGLYVFITNQPSFSVAASGLLVYAAGDRLNRLRWRDRAGRILADIGEPARHQTPRIAPDGRTVAFVRVEEDNADIWIAGPEPPSESRFTFDPGLDQYPIWSPDGRTVTFASGPPDSAFLYRKAADGSGAVERLTPAPGAVHAMDWSDDGAHLAYTHNAPGYGTDLYILAVTGTRTPHLFLQTPVSEAHSQFAPGAPARWIAYSSDDTGRREIYVAPFVPGEPLGAARWQVSRRGGTMPRWRGDGRELYYWALDGQIMAVPVDGTGSAFRAAAPVPLFQVQPPTLRTNAIEFDVTRDGQRFLLLEPFEETTLQSLRVVTNWLGRRTTF